MLLFVTAVKQSPQTHTVLAETQANISYAHESLGSGTQAGHSRASLSVFHGICGLSGLSCKALKAGAGFIWRPVRSCLVADAGSWLEVSVPVSSLCLSSLDFLKI